MRNMLDHEVEFLLGDATNEERIEGGVRVVRE